jgi:hypothetical protein
MKRALVPITALFAVLALAACASDTTNYPSLARRDVERAGALTAPQPSSAPTPAAPNPAAVARLGPLITQARSAHSRFNSAREQAQRTVAAGRTAARGSESWAVASVALAGLESARSQAMIALADLDEFYAAARVDGSDVSAIEAARDEVSGWIGEEDAVLATLRARLAA